MEPAKDYIAAIELSSSKIYGMVGRKENDGSIRVLAQAIEDSTGFMRKGVVLNLDKTAHAIKTIITKLEESLDETDAIGKVYVGVGGQSLHSKKNDIKRHLDEETIISQKLVDDISDENRGTPMGADLEILDVEPQEYKIGINMQIDPVGVAGSDIEGRFLNIVANAPVKKKLESSFQQANVEIADMFIAPIKAAKAVLTETEMRSGCALIDFGAGTTTVSVYKNNLLRFISVIPLGGNNITHDITTLQMEDEEAEQLKLQYGNVMYEEEAEDGKSTVIQLEDGSRTIELQKLNDIIEARAEEIVANVWNQIEYSGYEDKLIAGLVMTGGGANLRNLNELLRKKSKIQKVRIARFVRNEVHTSNKVVIEMDGTENTILGLLKAGTENCWKRRKIEVAEEEPAAPGTLFGRDAEMEKQAEEARRKREEEERQRKAEKAKKKNNWFKNTIDKISSASNDLFSDDEM